MAKRALLASLISTVAVAALGVSLLAPAADAAAHTKRKPRPKPATAGKTLSGLAALQNAKGTSPYFRSIEVAPEVNMGQPLPITGGGMARIWDLGVAWKDVNPAPGVFTWTSLDSRIADAERAGFHPLMVLGLTPTWAAADPSLGDPRWGAGTASPPAQMSYWTDYVQALSSRYGARIAGYEVWNEANLKTFWGGTPEQMANLTNAAYDVIKANNPNAIVLASSVTTRLRHAMETYMPSYARALSNTGCKFDGYAIHTYPAGNLGAPARVADVLFWENTVVGALPSNSPCLSKYIFDTEVNYGVPGPGPIPGTKYSDADGAGLITQTYKDSKALGIDATFWYLYTAAPFSLLGVQLYSGTPQSIAAFNAVS